MGQYLTGPCTLVELEESDGTSSGIHFAAGTMQGWRASQEDAHIAAVGLKQSDNSVIPDTALFAVFDGHGGKEVALFTEERFEQVLVNLDEFKAGEYEKALRRAFHRIDDLLEDLAYDKILKGYKKIPHPSNWDQGYSPGIPVHKANRNIRFFHTHVRLQGPNDNILDLKMRSLMSVAANELNKINTAENTTKQEPTKVSAAVVSSLNDIDDAPAGGIEMTSSSSSTHSSSGLNEALSTVTSGVAGITLEDPSINRSTHDTTSPPLPPSVLVSTLSGSSSVAGVRADASQQASAIDNTYPNISSVVSKVQNFVLLPSIPPTAKASSSSSSVIEEEVTIENGMEPIFVPETDRLSISPILAVEMADYDNDDTANFSGFATGSNGVINLVGGSTLPLSLSSESAEQVTATAPPYPSNEDNAAPRIGTAKNVCRLSNHRINAGCTAVVALKIKDTLYVANAGDSRAVLCRGDGKAYDLSIDHKPTEETEHRRVYAAGGFVNSFGRINGNLNLSRSLGDLKYKQNKNLSPAQQIITADPDIVTYQIQADDKFIILGCDGIWDCLTSQIACDIVREKLAGGMTPSNIVTLILEGILGRDTIQSKGIGTDNMTLIIVVL